VLSSIANPAAPVNPVEAALLRAGFRPYPAAPLADLNAAAASACEWCERVGFLELRPYVRGAATRNALLCHHCGHVTEG